MKIHYASTTAMLALAGCGVGDVSNALYEAPEISNVIDGVVFEAGNSEPHVAAGAEGSSWGNHRAVVEVDSTQAEAVLATIPWRRLRDHQTAR